MIPTCCLEISGSSVMIRHGHRYSPKYLHVDGGTFTVTQPEWVQELTPAQRAVLEPPYRYDRPELELSVTDERGVRVLQKSNHPTPDGRGAARSRL
jgi:hypothetical protein